MTMTKSAVVQARVEPELKKEVDAVLSSLGLNATTAITLFYTQILHRKGLPFEVKIPNEETLEAMREVRDPEFLKTAKRYSNVDELFANLDR